MGTSIKLRMFSSISLDKACRRIFKTRVIESSSYDSLPRSLFVVDVNDDTHLDITVANSGTDTIGIFYGFGNGTFQNQQTYSTEKACRPYSIVVGDFNQDNLKDIIVACHATHSLNILLAHVNKTFNLEKTFSINSSRPVSLAATDLNHDHRSDLVVINQATNDVCIYFGSNDSRLFIKPTRYSTGYDSYPNSVAIGDVNNDKHVDIVITNFATNDLLLLLGDGSGSFSIQKAVTTGYGSQPGSVAIFDINKDSYPDIIVANKGTNSIGVLLGLGNGTFEKLKSFSTGYGFNPTSLAVGYLTSDDDYADIATVASNGSDVIILKGLGNGSFLLMKHYSIPLISGNQYIDVGDFNNDQILDMVISNDMDNDIVALVQYSFKQFMNPMIHAIPYGFSPNAVVTGDFNNDSIMDIVYSDYQSNYIGVSLGIGNGTFTIVQLVPLDDKTGPYMLATGDFDNDGKLDVAFPNVLSDSIGLLVGNGKGRFAAYVKFPIETGAQPRYLAVGNLNNDNILDIVTANFATNSFSVFFGIGNCTFSSQVKYSTGLNSFPVSLALGDFNLDSRLDIVVAAAGSSNILIFYGSENGNFTMQENYLITGDSSAMFVAVSDFNNDHHLDIALVKQVNNLLNIFLGSKNGTFELVWISTIKEGSNLYSLAIGDFNNDNKSDIILPNEGTGTIYLALGNGNGSFLPEFSYSIGIGSLPHSIATGNFNGDQWLDIVIADLRSGNIMILLGMDVVDEYHQSIYSTGSSAHPFSFSVGDLNHDNLLDITVSNTAHGSIGIRIGLTDGNFEGEKIYSLGSNSYPKYITIDDIDKDNLSDILIAHSRNDSITLLLGYENGSFKREEKYSTGMGSSPTLITTMDLNNDTRPDLVVVNSQIDSIGVFLAFTYPTFRLTNGISVGTNSRPQAIVLGDFNADHSIDVALVCDTISAIVVLLGNGDGTFQDKAGYLTGIDSSPLSLSVGDFNDDHFLDIVVSNLHPSNIVIFMNLGNGTFNKSMEYNIGNGSSLNSIAVGHFNRDTSSDIVVADFAYGNIYILFGLGNGVFENKTTYSLGPSTLPTAVAVTNLNQDEYLDIVVPLSGTNQVAIFLGTNDGILDEAELHSVGTGIAPRSVAIANFDMNNYVDVVVANLQSGDITVLLNYNNNTFNSIKMYNISIGSYPIQAIVADLNDDNHTDIVVSLLGADAIALFFGYGNGDFTYYMTYSTGSGSNPIGIVLGDFNNDKLIDVAVANAALSTVIVLIRETSQLFLNQISYSTGTNSHPSSIAIADFNTDGLFDIAINNQGDDSIGIFINKGDGSLSSQINFPTGYQSKPQSIAAGDLNNDSMIDLVFTSPNTNCIGILLGNGRGNFSLIANYSTGENSLPSYVTLSDFNNDKMLDIAITNVRSSYILILFGEGNGTFVTSDSYSLGYAGNPGCTIAMDLNKDNWTDIIVLKQASDEIDILEQVCEN